MMIILSPAKSLDFDFAHCTPYTLPRFLEQSNQLVELLKNYSEVELSKLLDISHELAHLNVARFAQWKIEHQPPFAKQAILAYNGDVYEGLDASTLTPANHKFAQAHFRIISGLYGLLRPLDMILPYRLEMVTKIENLRKKNLYQFWSRKITETLVTDMKNSGDNTLINLASNEYSRAIDRNQLKKIDWISPEFREFKNGEFRVIGFFAKKARGMMARYIIKNQLSESESLKLFNEGGYSFHFPISTPDKWVFVR